MKNFYRLLLVVAIITLTGFSVNAQNVGIGTASPAQKLEIAGTGNTVRINGLKAGGAYNPLSSVANSNSNIVYVNNSTGDIYALPSGSLGAILTINAAGVPTWSSGATSATAWQLTGNSGTTPGVGAGQNYIGTTDVNDFILATDDIQRMRISAAGLVGINTNPVTGQQLTVVSASAATAIGASSSGGGTAVLVTASGNGIGVSATGSGGGIGVLGSATGNTGSFNGGYGVEGTASAGGTGVWAASSGQTNGSISLGGFGVFATGTYNAQAGVYAFLNGVSGGTPSPHGTTIPALGAIYAQTTSTSTTTTPNAWAIIANNSGSATPTNNGLLVFGTTSVIGTVTLGANSTSYFTSGGAKANGSLVFDNATNTNTVTLNTGVTTASYSLNLPTAQASTAGQVLINDGTGNLSWASASASLANLTPGTGLTGSAYNGSTPQTFAVNYGSTPGSAVQGNTSVTVAAGTGMSGGGTITLGAGGTITLNNTGVLSVGVSAPIYNTGTATAPVIGIQGSTSGVDIGGILYSTGSGTSAVFNSTGTLGQVLESSGTGAPTWVTPTGGTVTSVSANLPLSVTNPTTTPALSLIGGAGALLYGTGTASAFTTAGTAGELLESGGTGAPTWSTGSGQFIQNQNSASQTANFYISGNASIGTAPVSGQQLTIGSSGSGSIGVYSTNTAGSGVSVEGINSGGGTGLFGTVSGNTSSNNGGYGVEGAASSGGVGVWANSSGQTNATTPIGGFGVFATGTYNAQAGVYAFLNGVSGGTPSPHGTTIPALGAIYAQTTSTSTTTTPNAWAIIANNSGSATPTNNGLLVFGTTSEIGTVTLGANSTSYFTTGGAKANGSLVFDNATNTNTVTLNTGVTTASYSLNLPTAQAATAGQVLTNDGTGNLSWTSPTSGTVTSVGATAPIYNTGTATAPVIGIQGSTSGTDIGGILYSTGSGTSAVFNTTGTIGQVLESNGTGAPTWVTPTTGTVTSVSTNLPLSVTNPTTTPALSLIGGAGTLLYGTGTASAFTTAGTAGELLESGGTGAPTWSTGSGQFIQNQNSASQTANFYISGNASIGTAPVTGQQLTIAAPSGGTAIVVSASGSGSIGEIANTTASSGGGIEGNNTGGGFGVFGNVSGNTSSGNGGYAVEGTASSGGTGVFATSSGDNTLSTPEGGYGVFATGSSKSQAAIYGYVGSGAPSGPNGTAIPAIGAVYGQTGTAGNWALIANNSSSTTAPSGNGLLVYGTTNALGTVTLGSNSTSYFTTGGVKSNGQLVFDNATNTNTVTINTGVTTASYSLNLPTAQAATAGQVLTNDGTGNLSWATPSVGTVTSVGTTAPIYNTGTATAPVIGIQGSTSGTDIGGILYSTGSGTSAVFNSTGTTGQVLTSNGTGTPTWVTPTTSGTAWQLTGNASTIAGTNFVGTTDANDLVFKTKSTENMRIANSTGFVGINTPTPNSTLQVNGSLSIAVKVVSANDTAKSTDYFIEGNCSAGSITITLPDATTMPGRVYFIAASNIPTGSGNTVTITTEIGTQSIGNYGTSMTLSNNYEQEYVVSDGSNWFILASSKN